MSLTSRSVVACLLSLLTTALTNNTVAQNCDSLTASWSASESRCKATGTVEIAVKGGSGNYNYMVAGPVSTGFTSSPSIGGLPGGTYMGTVKDVVSGCMYTLNNIVVPGSYIEPRFGLTETDVSCTNGSDGTVSATGLTNGRGPFNFWLVVPSTMLVGGYSATGNFTGLIPGVYTMQMLDSCGAIQTRTISIQNYSWAVYTSSVVSAGCTNYNVQLTLRDSKGNFNTGGTAFTGFQYGVVAVAGDTVWYTTPNFTFDLGQNRKVALVAKDRCGAVQSVNWSNGAVPSIGANLSITSPTCTGFNVSVMNAMNLTTPQYCLVDASGNPVPGQPCNGTGSFTNVPYGAYCMRITNSCYDTVMSRCFTETQPVPALTGAIALSAYTCTGATATVTGQHLTGPNYCIVDATGAAVPGQPCNRTGVFVNVPYGSHTVYVTDGCSGTVLSIGFASAKLVKSVASTVTISGGNCSGFNASLGGAVNMTSPEYCLIDSLGNTVACTGNGVFNGLAYGSYCINVTDACGDTTIQRCFHQYLPAVSGGTASVSSRTCTGFTVTVTGQSNVYNGQYCLLDSTGNPAAGIPCNGTGVFTNVPYGHYCIQTTDACSGTVNTVCFSAVAPIPTVGPVVVSNKTCAGFTATQTGQRHLTSPTYCLLDALGNTVGSCNATGVFAVSAYGSYTIQTTDGCADTVLLAPFSVSRPIPSVSPTVNFTNQNCIGFTATIVGQTNLTNPLYFLVDSLGDSVSMNNMGVFAGIPYGSYCINIKDGCGDTTITRCFSLQPNPIAITLTAKPSCTYDATDVNVNITSGFGPFTVMVYDLFGHLLADTTASASTIVISGLPKVAIPLLKVVVSGSCGSPTTNFVVGTPTQLNRSYQVVPKCPSSAVPSGSGDLHVTASSNLTPVNLQITQFNFSPVSISYSFNAGSTYTFSNLDAGTYVVTYSFSSCSSTINDTVVVPPYTFPGLDRSAAYQCNDNSFTISGSASGGVSPFTYAIIGSVPSSPVVNTAPQSSPLFSINTGAQYSLIRLRAVDACGNSALADVDILPLQNTIISATGNCFNQGSTLSVNTIPNAVYGWYYKPSDTASDSTLVGTDTVYTIGSVTAADTGVYVNRMSINSGCLTQLSYFHLDGSCSGMWLLPLSVVLSGQVDADGSNLLTWEGSGDATGFIVERSAVSGGGFAALGAVDVAAGGGGYVFRDASPLVGTNFYRLRVLRNGGNATYSNVVALPSGGSKVSISVFPNPVTTELTVAINGSGVGRYRLSLFTATGQLVYSGEQTLQTGSVVIRRTMNMVPGLYMLRVDDAQEAGAGRVFKVLLQ